MGTVRIDRKVYSLERILKSMAITVNTSRPLPQPLLGKVARYLGESQEETERAYERLQNALRLEARGWTIEGRDR